MSIPAEMPADVTIRPSSIQRTHFDPGTHLEKPAQTSAVTQELSRISAKFLLTLSQLVQLRVSIAPVTG